MTKIPSSKQFLNFLASFFLCCFAAFGLWSSVLAQSPTETPDLEQEIPASNVTPPVDQEKIKEIRDKVREKVQEKIQEIRERGIRRGYVGQIEAIANLQITLSTRRGERKVSIDEDTKIIGQGRQTLEIEDLQVGDVIIAMGYVNSEGEMIAKRIVVIPKPPKPPLPRRAVFGRVTEIDQSSLILTLIHPRKDPSTLRVEVTSKTRITKKLEGKIQKVDFANIAPDDRLVAVGTWDEENEILTAKLLHIIPGNGLSL